MKIDPIQQDGVILKNLDVSTFDCRRYLSWLQDPDINQYLEVRHNVPTEAGLRDYVRQMESSESDLLLGIHVDDVHIGNIKLGPVNSFHKKGIIGLLIGDKAYWGKGYATAGISALTNYAVDMLGLNRLEACCYESNVGSQKAFLKAGYVKEGCFKQAWIGKNGYEDNIWFGYVA